MKRLKDIMVIFITVAVMFLSMGCAGIDGDKKPAKTPGNGKNEAISDPYDKIGFVMDGIDVPEDVLSAAKTQVKQLFDIHKADYPDYGYTNWRIENLVYSYAYDDLNGKKITIYQMNYEFYTESPENIQLAGGMYITEDNWVMPGYPNSTYLIFHQEDGKLNYLRSIVENDCTPGTELFTEDLLQILT